MESEYATSSHIFSIDISFSMNCHVSVGFDNEWSHVGRF
jgi:hypothetical protein